MASFAETGRLPEDASGIIAAAYGFVPNLFRAQSGLPAALRAESALIRAILLERVAFDEAEKHAILSAVAAANGNRYVFALHNKGDVGLRKPALLEFVRKFARFGPCVSKDDTEGLLACGLNDRAILEIIATVALGHMLCTLADALDPAFDAGLEDGI